MWSECKNPSFFDCWEFVKKLLLSKEKKENCPTRKSNELLPSFNANGELYPMVFIFLIKCDLTTF